MSESQPVPTPNEPAAPEKAPFNPKQHLINLKGKEYLPVNARIAWFREAFPCSTAWGIQTSLVAGGQEAGFATVHATVTDAEGRIIAQGYKSETKGTGKDGGFPEWVEKAETGAIGRALGLCGFGTLYALEFDDGTVCDAPVGGGGGAGKPASAPPAAGGACAQCGAELKKARLVFCQAKKIDPPLCPSCTPAAEGEG